MKNNPILVLGGAGFIGSQIVRELHSNGYSPIVVDGLLKNTGGARENLKAVSSDIPFFVTRIEECDVIDELLASCDGIIDSMALTSHHIAQNNPFYDLDLNLRSHLFLIEKLSQFPQKKIVYISAHSMYGKPDGNIIDEKTLFNPADVQGINKSAAEYYFELYSRIHDLSVASLRFGNCFGEFQKVEGSDIGLIGSFIRDSLAEKNIEVFGRGRKRNIFYAKDVAKTAIKLLELPFAGFEPFLMSGHALPIHELAQMICHLTGKGSVSVKEMPEDLKQIEIQFAKFSQQKLELKIGELSRTPLEQSLLTTIEYFKLRH